MQQLSAGQAAKHAAMVVCLVLFSKANTAVFSGLKDA
jgi:hypothetical protein